MTVKLLFTIGLGTMWTEVYGDIREVKQWFTQRLALNLFYFVTYIFLLLCNLQFGIMAFTPFCFFETEVTIFGEQGGSFTACKAYAKS